VFASEQRADDLGFGFVRGERQVDEEEGVALAKQSPADLYLFDIEMPVADGLEAADQLAAAGLRRPVVIVTGIDDPELIDRAIASGVAAYLTKPIDDLELEAAIKLALARHAEFEELESQVNEAHQALADRKLVERAKGLLMTALQLSEQEAFRRLQITARERNLKLVDVARRIVEQESLLTSKS
jgi:two-component system, response regulator PdtaR